jgi:sugar lactone lactonase
MSPGRTRDELMEDVPTVMLAAERCHLGEGPTYDAATDTAWWFDILERRLFQARIESGVITVHALDRMASALGRIDAQRQLIVAEDGLYIRYLSDGRMELFAPLEADNPATRSNDARVHPSGTLWLSTMGRNAEPRAGAIYALHRGRISRLFADVTIPNAICFAPSGEIGYFADTATNVMYRVALDAFSGLPVGDPAPFIQHRGIGGLDGAVVDADGLIWNARWGGGCVDVYDPTAKRLCSLRVPASQSSCPAFVGRDLSRLLVTSAWQGMDEAERASDPDGGRTFILEAAVRGRHEPNVKL